MGELAGSYRGLAEARRLESAGSFSPGPPSSRVSLAPSRSSRGVSAASNMQINEQPVLKMVLDLEVPGSEPRRVQRRVIVSNFAAPLMQPGVVLPVYVNPADPEDILIAW